MNCLICKQEMRVVREDKSSNPKTGAKYKRSIYVCDKDDAWLTFEIPDKK